LVLGQLNEDSKTKKRINWLSDNYRPVTCSLVSGLGVPGLDQAAGQDMRHRGAVTKIQFAICALAIHLPTADPGHRLATNTGQRQFSAGQPDTE
jgi:hypothetical protein